MSRIRRIRPFVRGLLTGALVAAALSVAAQSDRIAATLGLPATMVLVVLVLFGGATLYGVFVHEPRKRGDAGTTPAPLPMRTPFEEDESTVAMVGTGTRSGTVVGLAATSEELAGVSGGSLTEALDACAASAQTHARLAVARGGWDGAAVVLLGVAVLLLTVSIPFLIIYWLYNPLSMKRILKTGVFLASLCYSASYFLAHRERFPSPADKIGYFSGVVLGPVSVIEALS